MARLRVMTWNVLYKESAENILELIKEIDPDILCCQELTTDSHFNPGRNVAAEIAELLGTNFEYKKAFDGEDVETGTSFTMGSGCFSKLPIVGRRHAYVQRQDPNIKSYETENRVYVEIDVDINGLILKIGTVHLSFAPRFEMTTKKLSEIDKLYDTIKNNRKHFILTGDMNATPGSRIINKLTALLTNAGPAFEEKTWTTKPFSYLGFEADTLDWRLDYIFTTPDIKVVSSEIIKTEFSDHLPILSELEV